MKKFLLVLLFFSVGFSLFPDAGTVKITPDMSLKEVSLGKNIPFKKLTDSLKNGKNLTPDQTLNEAGISVEKINSIITRFREEERGYLLGVSGIGILIVFLSLIIISIIISLMRLFHGEKRQKRFPKAKIKPKGPGDLNPKVLAAISATIYLHEMENDRENELIVTLQRTAGMKMWKITNNMPNAAYYTIRRNK